MAARTSAPAWSTPLGFEFALYAAAPPVAQREADNGFGPEIGAALPLPEGALSPSGEGTAQTAVDDGSEQEEESEAEGAASGSKPADKEPSPKSPLDVVLPGKLWTPVDEPVPASVQSPPGIRTEPATMKDEPSCQTASARSADATTTHHQLVTERNLAPASDRGPRPAGSPIVFAARMEETAEAKPGTAGAGAGHGQETPERTPSQALRARPETSIEREREPAASEPGEMPAGFRERYNSALAFAPGEHSSPELGKLERPSSSPEAGFSRLAARVEQVQDAKPAQAASGTPVRELSLRLSPAGPDPVELKVAARDGAIHVAVHTANRELAASMRSQLSDLVEGLERAGYRAEAWAEQESVTRLTETGGVADAGLQDMPEDANSRESPQKGNEPGNPWRNGRGEEQSARDRHSREQGQRPRWVEEPDRRQRPGRSGDGFREFYIAGAAQGRQQI